MPTFEASDLEQGGKTSRVVNCLLALKSYDEWKRAGGSGVWKFGGGSIKPTTSGRQIVRKHSEPFMGFLSRSRSTDENSMNGACTEKDFNNRTEPNSSLGKLVRAILLDKKPEEVPNIVESVLSKVVEEFEHHIANQNEPGIKSMLKPSLSNVEGEQKNAIISNNDNMLQKNTYADEESDISFLKQQTIFNQQQNNIKLLKRTLCDTKAGMQLMQKKFHEEITNLGSNIHGLAHAASGYHKILEENRKLYNQVQDLKGSIRVYCRVRPFLPGQPNHMSSVDHIEEGNITINTLTRNGKGQKSFNFNKVFGPYATQEEVFLDTQPLVRSILDGYNVCIFAYGQTGSGKTYTMSGPKDLNENSQGVNYRALSDLFFLAEERKGTFIYDVFVQMIEIYNEQVRDLLITDGLTKRLEIKNSSQTGLAVPDANLVRVSSTSDVIDLMNIGQRNRAVGATALNDRSSRSHSCLTVHVQGRDLTSGNILRGCMHLVDLAGSERVDKSEATGDRLKEAQHINKSLSALGDVISSLAQKNSHVPYRNSKLTQLLQDSLGGQAKTLMFVHISPEPDAIGETISTLKFAERVATVELGAARVNKDSADVKELKEQIASLKAALARKDGEPTSAQRVSSIPCSTQPLSPFRPTTFNPKNVGLQSPNGPRKPMEDVGNIEVYSNSVQRKKRQNFDLDDLLGSNSPTWPPVSSLCLNGYNDDDREVALGEWVDKLMVNKQDPAGAGNPLACYDRTNHASTQKDLLDSPTYYPQAPYAAALLPSNTQFDASIIGDLDELHVGNCDSSDPDLLLQFNHSKPPGGISFSHGKLHAKRTKTPEFRSMIPKLSPSSVGKAVGGVVGQGQPSKRPHIKRKAGGFGK